MKHGVRWHWIRPAQWLLLSVGLFLPLRGVAEEAPVGQEPPLGQKETPRDREDAKDGQDAAKSGQDAAAGGHFEKRVRPILVEHCVSCHGVKKQESGLRLDSRAGALAGGEVSGPAIDLASPARSTLLRVVRHEGDIAMPPDGKLAAADVRAIERWLTDGAPWPATAPNAEVAAPTVAWKKHWAAQPVRRQQVPEVKHTARLFQPLDAFVLSRLEARGLEPAPIADARTLVRRAHFSLTGLPPTPKEVEQFTSRFAAGPREAMRELVDRLLESPHYGERWARHWLDVARYADTKGYVRLQEQPNYYYAYTYRDYVVRSFNKDLPYDRFVLEQLAADQLVGEDDNRSLAALGFLTLGRRFTGNQHDVIDDRIDVVTRGLMGLTVSWPRCHDHKFDPIPTDDYYSLYGVFASTTEPSDLPYLGEEDERPVFHGDMKAYRAKRAKLDEQVERYFSSTLNMLRADTTRYLHGVLGGRKVFLVPLPAAKGELRQTFVELWVEYLEGTKRDQHPVFAAWHALAALPKDEFETRAPDALEGLPINRIIREQLQSARPTSMSGVAEVYGKSLVSVHEKWVQAKAEDATVSRLPDPADEELRLVLYGDDSAFALSPREALDAYLLDAEWNRDLAQAYLDFDAWLIGTGKAPDRAHVLYDSLRVHEPHVFIRGNPERTGRRVARAAPRLLGDELRRPFQQGSGRIELARAIVSRDNPLTSRVIVNRVWKHHFGKGLVATTSNFGLRSDAPTHDRLLNYLSHRFMREGWSLKKLHRWILLSSTWQQSSLDRPDCRAVDPENKLLWRANRRRMDFESLRDALLSVAGSINLEVGGPPVSLLGPDNVRRTIYGRIDRSRLPTILRLFDFPSPDTHSPTRARTTAPQQALYLLNNPFVLKQSKALAERAKRAGDGSTLETVNHLYRLALGRPPTTEERQQCQAYVESDGGVWSEVAQTLLVSNEFLFID